MADKVSWTAVMTSAKVILARSTRPSDQEIEELKKDLDEIVPAAKEQVEAYTAIEVPSDSVSYLVLSREDWLEANIESYKYLISKLANRSPASFEVPGSDIASGVGLGVVLGWMATHVLGQYDLLLQNGADNESGSLYFVAPNIIEIERRFGFQKKQFRHWVALHELTHRAQFEGVPWFKPYFTSLVDEMLDASKLSSAEMMDLLGKSMKRLISGEKVLGEMGLAGLFVSDRQRLVVEKTTSLMSIAEGHGDWVMDRAATGTIPEAWQFSKTLGERRSSAQGATRLMQSLLGLEAKMNQYARGERFIEEVERLSPGSSHLVWSSPDSIPTTAEFVDVPAWLRRMGVSQAQVR